MNWRVQLRDDVQAMLGELDGEAGETLLDLMEVWARSPERFFVDGEPPELAHEWDAASSLHRLEVGYEIDPFARIVEIVRVTHTVDDGGKSTGEGGLNPGR